MILNRRYMIGLSAAGAAGVALGVPRAASAATDDVRADALAYFGKQGFVEVPPLGLITGHAFNGGLRYDDTGVTHAQPRWISIQPAARIEDIAQRTRLGVLAGFNIIVLRQPGAGDAEDMLVRVVGYLVDERKLDPTKLVFVSTEHFKPYLARKTVMRGGRFLERSLADAKAAGDGSGVFAPKGHPHSPNVNTVALYYPARGAAPTATLQYPPQGYIEIAEIEIAARGTKATSQLAAIGLERLAMAEGRPAPDFEGSRRDLLKAIEQDAKRTGKPLPPGYQKFASL
jgi:hypothetical protein